MQEAYEAQERLEKLQWVLRGREEEAGEKREEEERDLDVGRFAKRRRLNGGYVGYVKYSLW